MRKHFVLDTNVLLHDPHSIFGFDDNEVVLPIYVLEEIDKFKRDLNELGRSARAVSRSLDELRSRGSLSDGINLEGGGRLRVAFTDRMLPHEVSLTKDSADSKILAVALAVHQSDPDAPTILVTKDINLRLRGDALGLQTVDYETDRTDIDELYSGCTTLDVEPAFIDALYEEGRVSGGPTEAVHANQYVVLRDLSNPATLPSPAWLRMDPT